MASLTDDLARAAMAGTSTGGRTFTALAVLGLATPESSAQPDAVLGQAWVKAAIGLAAATELVMDKLPQTPSRLDLPGLPMRGLTAAVCGAIIARRSAPEPVAGAPADPLAPPAGDLQDDSLVRTAGCVTAAVAASLASSWLGVQWRRGASKKLKRDYLGACLEDVAAVGLAAAAARRA